MDWLSAHDLLVIPAKFVFGSLLGAVGKTAAETRRTWFYNCSNFVRDMQAIFLFDLVATRTSLLCGLPIQCFLLTLYSEV